MPDLSNKEESKFMKKLLIVVSVMLVTVFMLAACGGKNTEPTPTPAPTATEAAPAAEEATPVAAEASSGESASQGDPEKGQQLFVGTCSACHGPTGEGIEGLGKDMTTSDFIAGLSDAELVEFVKTGRDTNDPANTTGVAMPPKGNNPALTDEQLMDIVAYIRSIHK